MSVMAIELSGKIIIITGASSGIGRCTALALARERPQLVLVARRHELLAAVRIEVEKAGGKAEIMALDLTRREAVAQMIEQTQQKFGRIDVLINNAGFGFFGTVEATPAPVVDEIFALNFEAPLYATQYVTPIMRAQRSGHIVNVSSVAGKRGLPLSGVYCATKFALDGLTQALRLELASEGIRVSIVNPAATYTDFFDQVRRTSELPGKFKPMGSPQTAEHVAGTIVRCLKKPTIEVYPYRPGRLIAWLNVIAPSLVDRIMAPYFRDRMRAKIAQ
jgi:short-subunit dehydrogenase